MATPLRFKYKWPSQSQKSGTSISDFVPYVSNLANMFIRTPNPQTPTLVNPVVAPKISLANSRAEVDNATRAADLSTQGLDAQTGAAIRVGNMANRFRSLSDINSREAIANAQTTNQANMVNANIEAQNAAMTNAYHDDLTNAQLKRNELASSNLSNAADKYIGQKAAADQLQLEKEKANILSKMYNPGVYSRLLTKLQNTGTDTSNMGTPQRTSPFDKFRGMQLPVYNGPGGAPVTATNPITSPSTDDVSMDTMPANIMGSLRKFMKQRGTYATGGMMSVFGPGDPEKPNSNPLNPIVQFRNSTGVQGTNAFADNVYAMDHNTNRMAKGIDMISDLVKTGTLPHNAVNPRLVRDLLNPKMYNYLYEFNQRPDLAGMNPEQRLNTFYNVNTNDPDIRAMKANMHQYGYGVSEFNRNSPQTSLKKANGGGIHINPANEGKFTASANAAGMGVQEYAAHVLADDNASPLMKKRANFARNAAKWNRAYGGMIKPFA